MWLVALPVAVAVVVMVARLVAVAVAVVPLKTKKSIGKINVSMDTLFYIK
jgi:hypothetical protein